MDIRVLGPVEAWEGGRQVWLGGLRQRTVLAALALRRDCPSSVGGLIEAVWGDRPPVTARQQVHSAVSALRRAMGDAVETCTDGYRLAVAADRIDLCRFEAAVAAARAVGAAGDLAAALAGIRAALAMWRGPALVGMAALAPQATRLDERRLQVTEECIDIELRLGRHAAVVSELSELVVVFPLRERLVGQLMVALYRSGRRAEALEAYRSAVQRLADELGLDPGDELRQLQVAILRSDAGLDVPGSAAGREPVEVAARPLPVPMQLPPDISGFAGREGPLAALAALVPAVEAAEEDRDRPGRARVVAVTGTAGVGKTSLAVHWAHRVADRFPDGQLYVDLRGFDASGSAKNEAEAVSAFLEGLGVAPERIPAAVEARIGLYRSLLGGKRVLVVLDNARDSAHARPLLAGAPGCLTIVTSRDQLRCLVVADGAHPLSLNPLTTAEARQLLAHRLGPGRIAAEPDAVEEIIALCAELPLALAVLAARAAAHPQFSLGALAAEMDLAGSCLDALSGTDEATDVRAVLSWSYRTLSAGAARLFRLLGTYGGTVLTARSAASLAGVPLERVRPLLVELSHANLIAEPAPGRYTWHGLLRAYAAELAHTADGPLAGPATRVRELDGSER